MNIFQIILLACVLFNSHVYGYYFTWCDDFNGNQLDKKSWNTILLPSYTYNNELQEYKADNVQVSNGNLVITAERVLNINTGTYTYTSGRIDTRLKRDFRYGRFEARIKLPYGQGMWPAFWMMPTDSKYGTWPRSGEIDIMENRGSDMNTTVGTIHYGTQDSSGGSYTAPFSFADDYHLFAIEWDEYEIRWYVDGINFQNKTFWTTPAASYPAPFNEYFYVILNFAVGGFFGGNPDGTSVFPQSLLVDYVCVYSDDKYATEQYVTDVKLDAATILQIILGSVFGTLVCIIGCFCYRYRMTRKPTEDLESKIAKNFERPSAAAAVAIHHLGDESRQSRRERSMSRLSRIDPLTARERSMTYNVGRDRTKTRDSTRNRRNTENPSNDGRFSVQLSDVEAQWGSTPGKHSSPSRLRSGSTRQSRSSTHQHHGVIQSFLKDPEEVRTRTRSHSSFRQRSSTSTHIDSTSHSQAHTNDNNPMYKSQDRSIYKSRERSRSSHHSGSSSSTSSNNPHKQRSPKKDRQQQTAPSLLITPRSYAEEAVRSLNETSSKGLLFSSSSNRKLDVVVESPDTRSFSMQVGPQIVPRGPLSLIKEEDSDRSRLAVDSLSLVGPGSTIMSDDDLSLVVGDDQQSVVSTASQDPPQASGSRPPPSHSTQRNYPSTAQTREDVKVNLSSGHSSPQSNMSTVPLTSASEHHENDDSQDSEDSPLMLAGRKNIPK